MNQYWFSARCLRELLLQPSHLPLNDFIVIEKPAVPGCQKQRLRSREVEPYFLIGTQRNTSSYLRHSTDHRRRHLGSHNSTDALVLLSTPIWLVHCTIQFLPEQVGRLSACTHWSWAV